MITIKQRLIIVVCLSVLLIGLMVFEVIRTESMKLNYKEGCYDNTNRQCYCDSRGSPFELYQVDK